VLVTPRREVGRADCGCSLWLQARKSTGRHIDPDQPRRADRRARRTGAQGGCDVLTPSAREAASRRPECHGRSSSGSNQLRAASRPALVSVIPSRGGTSPGSPSFLTPGSARDLLQSPEGGRNRYFKIDSPFSATVTQGRGKHVTETSLQALRSPVWRLAFLVMFFARPPALVVLCGGGASGRPQSVPLARRPAPLIAVRSARAARRHRDRQDRPGRREPACTSLPSLIAP